MMRPIDQYENRFAQLLNGTGKTEAWDVRLFEIHDCVVAPSKGSIVPRWLLLVPREAFLNFAIYSSEKSRNPYLLVRGAAGKASLSDDWIWFEHGPCNARSSIGCGVDHAHIHLLYDTSFSFEEFSHAVLRGAGRDWEAIDPSESYSGIGQDESYYIFGNRHVAYRARGQDFGSQFFRKVIADLVGRADQWDYRTHPHVDNVVETLCGFAPLNEAA